jgi:nitrite reductase/ring-hydroxylating ferredoxin subunit
VSDDGVLRIAGALHVVPPADAPRVHAGTRAALALTPVLVVRLAPDLNGRPREALVLRDAQGVLRAYRNLCRHLPIPLDSGSRSFLYEGDLRCMTHGARYRTSDGVCVVGPCKGAMLERLTVEEVGDELFVIDGVIDLAVDQGAT